MRRLLPLLILLLALTPPGAVDARVFARWRAAAGGFDDGIRTLGGREIYRTAVAVNGVPGMLTVYAHDDAPRTLAHQIEGAWPEAVLVAGGPMLSGELATPQETVRLVILQPDPLAATMVIAVRQSPEARTERPSPDPPSEAMPRYPGGEPRFAAQLAASGAAYWLVHAEALPATAQAYCRQRLEADGWRAMPPATGALDMFARDAERMLVLVTATATPGEVAISMLHKRQGLK